MRVLLILLVLLPIPAWAVCPASVPIIDDLSCSSEITTTIDWQATSLLGGPCANSECYACGTPYDMQEQVAPEAVYTFQCQKTGDVLLTITNLPCDLDIYVLDDTCDPYSGCVEGSTASYAVDDSVPFTCTTGRGRLLDYVWCDQLAAGISSMPCVCPAPWQRALTNPDCAQNVRACRVGQARRG